MKLLHIDSSILGDASVSRALSADVLEKFRERHDSLEVIYRDLAAEPLAHFSGATLGVMMGALGEADPEDLAISGVVLDEFLSADIVVIGVAFYNFTVPSQMKAWIDRLLLPNKTFRYTPEGPVGLVGGKRVIIAMARGGFYSAGSPAESCEHAESYLRAILGYIGITNPEFIIAEGLRVGDEQRKAALGAAQEAIAALAV